MGFSNTFVIFIMVVFLTLPVVTSAGADDRVVVAIMFRDGTVPAQGLSLVGSIGGIVTRELNAIGGAVAVVPRSAVSLLRSNPLVHSVDTAYATQTTDSVANAQIHADQVWPMGYTGAGIRVAVLDSGISQTHPEFTGRIALCHSEQMYTQSCEDDFWHGTHVAGIAAAAGVLAQAKGVAPAVQLLVDKTQDQNGGGDSITATAGIDWAVASNARVINLSIGGFSTGSTQANCDGDIPTLTAAVNRAVAAGITVVASAGNNNMQGWVPGAVSWPGCISNTIAVGAVDASDNVATFSDTGLAMADHGVAAPGNNSLSAFLNGQYAYASGTSQATPVVTGLVALLLQKSPNLTPAGVRSILYASSDCVPSGTNCPNNNVGHGRVNAIAAINTVLTSVTLSPTSVSFYCNRSCDPSQNVDLLISSLQGSTGTVSLSYLPPGSGSGGTSLTGPSSATVPITGIHVTLTASPNPGSPRGSYVWTARATAGGLASSGQETIIIYRCIRPPCPGVPTP